MIRFPVLIRSPVPVLVLPLLLAAGGVPSAATDPEAAGDGAGAGGKPMVVTSDTASYCSALSERVASRAPLPEAVCALRREGDALCARGQIRTGIRRLRRALMALDAEGGAGGGEGGGDENAAGECR